MADDGDQRVDRGHGLGGRLGLGPPHVGDAVDDLALEVGGVDHVVVDDADGAHPGRGEVEQRRRPETAGADHEHPRALASRRCPSQPDLGQQDVPGVAGLLLGA